jgi:hypothetical protein
LRYEPTSTPDASRWLETPEGERLDAVLRQHEMAGEKAGSLRMHAAIHVTVETQLAEGHAAAVRAMQRLTEQGLDRHEALHAVGSAVAGQIFAALKGRSFDAAEYEKRLDALTVDSWRNSSSGG